MSEHTPEGDAARLTDKEIELREWLRSQPGGAERWTVVKAGFRRSYDMGMRDSLNARPDAEIDVTRRLDQIEQTALRVRPTDVGKWAMATGKPSAASAVVIAPADLYWLLAMVRATRLLPSCESER